LKEFADKGYEQASTNRIVKDAGIGKGMLFYYFNNKKDLYDYLVNYALDITNEKYLSLIDIKEPDFIERMRQVARIKMKTYAENPDVFNFLGSILLNQNLDLSNDLEKRINEMKKSGFSMMYENIDTSLLRDDIAADKAFRVIRWSIEGYQNELMNRLKGQIISTVDMNPYWDEFHEFLDVLKTSFYTKGG
jgi:TetR/AcrR family transcriptional regulator